MSSAMNTTVATSHPHPAISPRLAVALPVEDGAVITYGENGSRALTLDSVEVVVSLTTAGTPHVAITARGTRSVDGDVVADSRTSMAVDEFPGELREIVREQVDRLSALAALLAQDASGDSTLLSMPSL